MPRKAVSAPRPVAEIPHTDDAVGSQEDIAVWLAVHASARPRRMARYLGELAGPDFALEACRESARPAAGADGDYHAHWYCRFTPRARDSFAAVRLLKRLTGAGFDVLRFDAGVQTTTLNSAA